MSKLEPVIGQSVPAAPARSATKWLLAAALVLAVVLTYQPAWNAGFIWDDDLYVTDNPLLTAADGWSRIWFSTDAPSQYFPLVYSVFRLEHGLWGLNASGYHWVNLLLHAANALLVWSLLRRLGLPGPWLAAAIFALHPVQVESVAWITELKNVLSLFFFLLALRCWIEWIDGDRAKAQGRLPAVPVSAWYAGALVCHQLALFSKTTACTLPAALLLILWIRGEKITRRSILAVGPFVFLGLVMGLVSIWWERHHQGTVGDTYSLGLLERFLIAGRAVWFYVGKVLWPTNLTFSYPLWTINAADPRAYAGLAALAGLAAVVWKARRRFGRGPETALVFFVAMLLPMLGFFVMYTFKYTYVADHYVYVALIGPAALVAGGLAALARRLGDARRSIAPVAATVLVLGLAALSWRQAHMYRDLETLWRTTIARNPTSFMGHNNLGAIHLVRGEADVAIAHFERAIEILPDHGNAHGNLGHALLQKGDLAAALAQFERAASLEPQNAKAQSDLGFALLEAGQIERARGHCERAVELEPEAAEARNMLALALLRAGRPAEAVAQARRAVALHEPYPEAHFNLGLGLSGTGDFTAAVAAYERALALAPALVDAHLDRGIALAQLGRFDEAIASLRAFVAARPDSERGHLSLAGLLAQSGRLAEAVPSFEAALRLNPGNGPVRTFLARCLLESGQTEAAVIEASRVAEGDANPLDALAVIAAAQVRRGNFDDAVQAYDRMLALQPDNHELQSERGWALLQAGRADEAVLQLESVLAAQPELPMARVHLAMACLRKGRAADAIAGYRIFLDRHPEHPFAMADLAWIFATWNDASVRNPAAALEMAERANQLSGDREPLILRTLAAAYAENGKYPEAVRTAERALQLAEAAANRELAGALRQHLGHYTAGSPFREGAAREVVN